MIKLQEIINELEITPNIFKIAADKLCGLSVGIEFCDYDNNPTLTSILDKFNIPKNDTDYFDLSDLKFPIKSLDELKYQILKQKLIK